MAVIGARQATGVGLLGRRPRRRPQRAIARPPLRSGADRGRRTLPAVPSLLMGIAAAAGLALFYLSQSTQVAAGGYLLDSLRSRITELQAAQQELLLQIGQARSPATIEQRALEDLDLVPLPQSAITFAPSSTESQ